ncbi:MAG: aminotransferase class I/II-fold pyridoxal phosphate-dependent enzyme [Campylobacteraceae bacterium]|mgnify:FL=1|jgi:alanine-synthesizing transaminase|nr:aminotransferase class I/II-fold pyridoxal phosphate-dependent enzyme [Campylobacteraceae bacterium]MBT3882401.1 aminotransferase class I/II-fold pyridoxal phosphate-dependent enzyme [Campylobacteraceae bacterium]MBT4030793.1 aminotransferase class I/II-fold pyridoxal phosphate-dependent enzyme [Campylobacteraceae bacterium]MBT4179875.1 aminotransferase class I/II-fold pyridoxal phosphate-dependent enzyme [Campylobacteraceae bacterium]MBT4572384.1 aminotransferase class I/II-fold pyridoxal p
MFDEIRFNRVDNLPKYVFAEINDIKAQMKKDGQDVIDFSMGNPDQDTPEHIVDALVDSARTPGTHGYSPSQGIPEVLDAIASWYKDRYGVNLDTKTQTVATIGSKDGYSHLAYAVTNPGDVAVVPTPTYPIHTYSFILAGGAVEDLKIKFDENYNVDEDDFFDKLTHIFDTAHVKPKYVLVNFPHNPTSATVTPNFYKRLVAMAKERRFYIISDIAYGDISFGGYKTPSIMEVEGALDVAVESFTVSKSYNMAGWRIGFFVGNKKLIGALVKLKSWLDYGMFTPIQKATVEALTGDQTCVDEITGRYNHRQDVLIEEFAKIGWNIKKNKASMFSWAKIPDCVQEMGTLEFCKRLLEQEAVAMSPGVGFGDDGEGYVRIALIQDDARMEDAAQRIGRFLENNCKEEN